MVFLKIKDKFFFFGGEYMALKNHEDISAFGKKILALMAEKKCDSPKILASKLYSAGLVTVKSKGKDIYKRKDNAIGSIEKKIRVHIHSDNPSCLQGEFVLAYCKFFECSADYLFGLTEIKSSNINIRKICEKTGLSEEAVLNLCGQSNDNMREYKVGIWSMILASPLYCKIPEEWLEAQNQAFIVAQNDVQLKMSTLELEHISGPDRLDIQNDIEGYEKRARSGRAAIAGLMFNVSRNIANFIEAQIVCKMKLFSEKYEAEFIDKR